MSDNIEGEMEHWREFSETCAKAADFRDHLIKEAEKRRDRVYAFAESPACCAREQVVAEAKARHDAKVKDARTRYDQMCEKARQDLSEVLDATGRISELT